MKGLKKILKYLFVFIFLIFFALIILLKSGIFTEKVKNYIEKEFFKISGEKLYIGKIELGIYNNVVIKDIDLPLKKQKLLKINSIVLRFNIIDIFLKKKDINKSLSKIVIDGITLNIIKENNKFNLKDFLDLLNVKEDNKKINIVFPTNKIYIKNGKINFSDKDKRFFTTISSIQGKILLKLINKNVLVFLSGKTKYSTTRNLNINLKYNLKTNKFYIENELKHADLNHWISYINTNNNIKIHKGYYNLYLNMSGHKNDIKNINIKGILKIKNTEITLLNKLKLTNLYSEISIINDNLLLRTINFSLFNGQGIIKGKISNIFNLPKYNGNIVLKNINLEKINKNMKGAGNISLNISGIKNNFNIIGNILSNNGKIYYLKYKDIESDLMVKNNILFIKNIKGEISGGELKGDLIINLKNSKRIKGNIKLKKLNLKHLVGLNNNLKGKLDLSIKPFNTLDNIKIDILIKSKKIKYKKICINNLNLFSLLTKNNMKIIANFDYADYKNLILKSKVLFLENTIKLKDINIVNTEKKELLKINGNINKITLNIDLSISLDNIVLSKMHINYFKDKKIDGILKGIITTRGNIKNPEISCILNMNDITISDEKVTLFSNIIYKNNVLSIKNFNFNNTIKGEGDFSFPQKIFIANFSFNKLKGNILNELTGINMFKHGYINGLININKAKHGYGGNINVNIKYKKGYYKNINVNIKGEENKFKINNISIKQKKGKLNLTGFCNISKKNISLDINGKTIKYRINKDLNLTGDLKILSKLNVDKNIITEEKVEINNMFFNKEDMGNVKIYMKTQNFTLTYLDLFSNDIDMNWKLIKKDIPILNIKTTIKDSNLYFLYALLEKGKRKLKSEEKVSAEIEIKGPFNNCDANFYIFQKEGNINLKGKIQFIKNRFIYIPKNLNLTYYIENLNLKNFMNIFKREFKYTGRMNGKGNFKMQNNKIFTKGYIMFSNGKLPDVLYDNIILKYNFKNNRLYINKGILTYKNTYLDFSKTYIETNEQKEIYSTVKTKMKDFVWRGNRLNGNVNFYGRINTYKHLVIDGAISFDNFMFKRKKFSPFLIKVNYNNEELKLKTRKGRNYLYGDIKFLKNKLFFKEFYILNSNKEKILTINGFLSNKDSNLLIKGDNLNPQTVNDLLDWEHKWTGILSGNIKVSGGGEKLGYTIYFNIKNGSVNDIPFDIASGLLTLKNDELNLSPFGDLKIIKENKYNIKVSGKIPVPMSEKGVEKVKGKEMDVSLKVKKGDLSLIKFISWIKDASGRLDLDIKIKGTKDFPVLNGKINISNGSIKLKYLFDEIQHVYGNILIKNNIFNIFNLIGDTKTGTLKISNLSDDKGGSIKFFKVDKLNLKVKNIGNYVYFSNTEYMQFFEGIVNLDLDITGTIDFPIIEGKMKVIKGKIIYPVRMKEKPQNNKENYVKKITWNLDVYGGDEVYYYNNYYNNYAEVKLKLPDAPLQFRGKGDDLKIYGTMFVTDGTYKYMNTEFNVDKSRESKVIFDGNKKPILDIYAKTIIRRIILNSDTTSSLNLPAETIKQRPIDLNVYLHASGRVGNISINVTSEPSLERNRLLFILTFGKDIDPNKNFDANDASKLADAIASFWVKRGEETIKEYTPLDSLNIKFDVSDILQSDVKSDSTSNTLTSQEAKVKVEIGMGKYLFDNLYIDYNLRLLEKRISGINTESQDLLDFQHYLGLEYSLDETKKLKFYRTFNPSKFGMEDETFLGIESRITFDTWGSKNNKPQKKETPVNKK